MTMETQADLTPTDPAWRKQLDLLLASTGDGIFVMDMEGR